MSTNAEEISKPSSTMKSKNSKREVKILMLHGYTQSGPLFHAKTRALEKLLTKTLAPISLEPALIYPTGPNRLAAADLPGYEPPEGMEDHEPDTWAWFRKNEAQNTYDQWEKGMDTIARAIAEAGGIDGVCGFSQGGAVSGAVAAAMEAGREVPKGGEWAQKLRDANAGKPLKFAVVYSGFRGSAESLRWCYEPKITTPTLHFMGSLDTIVDETRVQGLIDRCVDPVVMVHPGGHHVPIAKEWAMRLAGFIKQHGAEDAPQAGL